jgi:transcriptional regulator with XRE-family HTH domain
MRPSLLTIGNGELARVTPDRAVVLMPNEPETPERDRLPMREDFIRALYWLMEERNYSQRDLADGMGWPSHTKINPWRNLRAEPTPDEVFGLERFLRVPPGTLSKHLGYLPPEARAIGKASVEEAIAADPMLPDWGRRLLIASYREILSSRGGRRRG